MHASQITMLCALNFYSVCQSHLNIIEEKKDSYILAKEHIDKQLRTQ